MLSHRLLWRLASSEGTAFQDMDGDSFISSGEMGLANKTI